MTRSWDDLMRHPAPAYLMQCGKCPRQFSGNNHRKVKADLTAHTRKEHGGAR
jgi:hypothetical protein